MEVSIRRAGEEVTDVKIVLKRRKQTLPELSSVREAFNISPNTRISLLDSLGMIEDAANIDGDEELTLIVGEEVENLEDEIAEDIEAHDSAFFDDGDDDDGEEPKKRRSKRKRTTQSKQTPPNRNRKSTPSKKPSTRRSSRRPSRRGPIDDFVVSDDDEIEESDDGDIRVGKQKKHRTKSTSRRRQTKQSTLQFNSEEQANPFNFASDSDELPDEPGQEDGDSVCQTEHAQPSVLFSIPLPTLFFLSERGFKFIGCFVTSLRGKGKKSGDEWEEINHKSGAQLTFEVKIDERKVTRADGTVETNINTNVIARKRAKKQEVGRMLSDLNKRMIRLIDDDVLHITGEIYTNQTIHAASAPLLVKVFVYLNPEVHYLVSDGDGDARVRCVDVNKVVKEIIRCERKIDPWWTHEAALDPRAKEFQDFVEDDEEEDDDDSDVGDGEDRDYAAPAHRRPSNLADTVETEEHPLPQAMVNGPARPGAIPPILPGTYQETIEALKLYSDPDEKKREVWIRTHSGRLVAIPELEQDPETLKDSVTQSAALSMVSMQQIVQNDGSVFTQDEILEACSMGTQTTILDGIYKASRFDKLELTSPTNNMVTELLPFQKQGLTWLRWRETPQTQNKSLNPFWTTFKSAESVHPIYINKETLEVTFNFVPSDPPPLGGILADEMGMGKTAQILSLVDLVNCELKAAGKRDEWSRATLIVCTASVLDHWNSEIKKHFKPNTFSSLRYHGSSKPKDPQVISKYIVVFTTYDPGA
eukprot:TRINITY_DN4116_c0_g1_i1.p1 TRINITY_DN4116_c0_g1~~TRINITY_DN4116_c0_g1_i1.p1  ORF type:complete len:788 (+),score=159.08 TRINITY_DN4116_c0_g1_i1:94-2364(+)